MKFSVNVKGWPRNIAENFNCLSRVHERYRQQTDRPVIAYSKRERELSFANKTILTSLLSITDWLMMGSAILPQNMYHVVITEHKANKPKTFGS